MDILNIVKLDNLEIGKGMPKVCIPIVDVNKENILKTISKVKKVEHDLIEIRIDYFKDVKNIDKVIDLLSSIDLIYKKPIIFTFRNVDEGGVCSIDLDYYFDLNRVVINSGLVDIVDIEVLSDYEKVEEIIDISKEKGVKIILSNHNFDKTDSYERMLEIFKVMDELDGDIYKIAQMPKSRRDVLRLLSFTMDMNKKYSKPIISMSMGKLGMISRISGEIFGSSITFGSLDKSSAPGQIEVERLFELLKILKL